MDSKITIPIAVAISVIVTAGIMYSIGFEKEVEVADVVAPIDPTSMDTAVDVENDTQVADVVAPQIVDMDEETHGFFEGTHEIRKISSQEELNSILAASALFGDSFYDGGSEGDWSSGMNFDSREFGDSSGIFIGDESMMDSEPASSKIGELGQDHGGSDYSTTNVQIKDVDEPDYLKNDSKYVYIVSGNTLSIIDAYPAESASLILKVVLDVESQYIQNMFLNKDRLVIFYDGESDEETIPQYDFVPRRSYIPVTHALIVDVSDKENPAILYDYSIDGYFRDARMIGNYAYFVTNSNIDHQYPRFPVIMENSIPIMTPDAFYFDNREEFSDFNTLTAIDIFGDTINSETFLMGYTGTFYVSEDNFYLTYEEHLPFGFYERPSRDRFFDVVVPLLPGDIQDEIKSIQGDSSPSPSVQWARISEVMQESYNEMDEEDRKELFEEISRALREYNTRVQEDTKRTIIHKISIDEDKMKYVARGSVPGMLLNQFSMDQEGDRFRVATTTEYYTEHEGWSRANAVYVLDEQLDIVGELDDIAPDESIFSARFMGDRLYLVTFQQIDPFFVIDLSRDTPRILGELKIPGFSNYLHPYDDEHVIGIGRDTKEIGSDRVRQLGIKIALFNVADVSNPRVADDIIIGDESVHSEALYDHKAFFFDGKRKILSIPVSGDFDRLKDIRNPNAGVPDYYQWNGFYVFDLDRSEGISIRGTIAHMDDDYYGIGGARTFYIDDVLYTASDRYLKMNLFDDLEEINSIRLENTGKLIRYIHADVR